MLLLILLLLLFMLLLLLLILLLLVDLLLLLLLLLLPTTTINMTGGTHLPPTPFLCMKGVRAKAVTVPLCCETQRETFSEVTAGFNDKFTASQEPVLLDLTGSNSYFGTSLTKLISLLIILMKILPPTVTSTAVVRLLLLNYYYYHYK